MTQRFYAPPRATKPSPVTEHVFKGLRYTLSSSHYIFYPTEDQWSTREARNATIHLILGTGAPNVAGAVLIRPACRPVSREIPLSAIIANPTRQIVLPHSIPKEVGIRGAGCWALDTLSGESHVKDMSLAELWAQEDPFNGIIPECGELSEEKANELEGS